MRLDADARAAVFFIFAAQLINLVVIAHNSWRVLVLGFLNPMNFVTPTKSFTGISVINGIVSFAVQGFFSWCAALLSPEPQIFLISFVVQGNFYNGLSRPLKNRLCRCPLTCGRAACRISCNRHQGDFCHPSCPNAF